VITIIAVRTITVADLRAARACSDQVRLFERTFPKGVRVTLRNLNRAVKAGLDIVWTVKLLTPEQRAEYTKAIAPALDEYEKAIAPARAEYTKVKASAWAEYKKATDSAWAEYEKARATARAKHEKAKATALAEYDKAKATAQAEHTKARNVVLVRTLNA